MTNYIMMELGQPMHAFDNRIVDSVNVKTLPEATKFTTLDGQERDLDKGTLMIWHKDTPVAIAGVMGGLESEIEDDTTTLFLESANFDAVQIRKTAAKLDLRTDAAAHYEKTLDPELTEIAIAREIAAITGRKLKPLQVEDLRQYQKLEELSIGVENEDNDNPLCFNVKKYPHITIEIDKDYIDRSIGKVLTMDEVTTTLKNLEYNIKVKGNNITIDVPTFRATKDVSQKADIIEEIARIHGYDNITPESNLWKIAPVEKDPARELEYSSKELLATKYGASEIHSYVWYNTELNNELGIKVKDNLKIVNGIVRLDNTLRHEMAPTMLYAIEKNMKYMNECKVFEIGRTFEYHFDGKEAEEYKVLGIGLASTIESEKDLVYTAKSMVDNIVGINKNLKVSYENVELVQSNWMHPVNTFAIKVDRQELGYITVVHPKIKDRINPKASIVVVEIRIDTLGEMAKNEVVYKEVSKYQTVNFDLSLIVDKDVKYGDIEEIINNSNMEYLMDYSLVDIYENAEKLTGKKAVTVRFTIGSYTDTLTKEQIDSEREKVLTALKEKDMYINE